jgi:hypothetical protein
LLIVPLSLHKLNLFVALARAGGIPARYRAVGGGARLEAVSPQRQVVRRFFEQLEGETDWRLRRIGAGLRRRAKPRGDGRMAWGFLDLKWHPFAEVSLGGFWIPANPTLGDADAAALGLPLPRFGYDPMTLRGTAGSLLGPSEAVPVGRSYWVLRRLACLVARGALDYVNRNLEERRVLGRQILGDVGETEYIRRLRRFYVPVAGLTELKVPSLLPGQAGCGPRPAVL